MSHVAPDSSPHPDSGEVAGRAIAATAMLGAGAVFGSVGTLGASFLPLMAATALSMPISLAGQSVAGHSAAMVAGGVAMAGLPLAFVAVREGLSAAGGSRMWRTLLNTGVGKKAVELTEAMGAFRVPAVMSAVSAGGLGALMGTHALTGSSSASMLALAAAGSAVLGASAVVSGMRQEHARAPEEALSLAQKRAARAASQVDSEPVPRHSSGPSLA